MRVTVIKVVVRACEGPATREATMEQRNLAICICDGEHVQHARDEAMYVMYMCMYAFEAGSGVLVVCSAPDAILATWLPDVA